MNKKVKKTIKVTAITLASVIALVLIVIGIVIGLVFTPSKITPVVEQIANNVLDAEVKVERVELTFFSSFPNFSLKIDDGEILTKVDSTVSVRDSLLTFNSCRVSVNPLAYIFRNKVILHELRIDSASVYAFVDKSGVANWNIVKPTDIIEEEEDTTSSFEMPDEIVLKKVRIKKANIIYDDRSTDIYARLQKANLGLGIGMNDRGAALDLRFKCGDLLFWQNGKLLLKKISPSLKTKVQLDRHSKQINLEKAELGINDIKFHVDGTIEKDTVIDAIATDLRYSIVAPSVEKMMNVVTEHFVESRGLTAKGVITLQGDVTGAYGNGHLPFVTLTMKIDDAAVHYDGLPFGIDYLVMDFGAQLDFMKEKESYLDLKILELKSNKTDILVDAHVTELFNDPLIEVNTTSQIDLNSVVQTLPLKEGVTLAGAIDADLRGKVRLSTIKNQDFGRIFAGGKLLMDNVTIQDTSSGFDLHTDGAVRFGGGKALGADVEIRKLNINSKKLFANIDSLSLKAGSTRPADTTSIFRLGAKIEMKEVALSMFNDADTTKIYCGRGAATARLKPQASNPQMPRIEVSIEADSLNATMAEMVAGMKKGRISLNADKLRDSLWIPDGNIDFSRMYARLPNYALPIRFNKATIDFGNKRINLKKARLRVGRSNLVLSGYINNLYGGIKRNEMIDGQLDINSKNINLNQLLGAMSSSEMMDDTEEETESENQAESTEVDTAATDSTSQPLQLFVVPRNVDFRLNLNLNRLTFNEMVCTNINGKAEIKDQNVYLENFSLNALGAELKTTAIYRASSHRWGYTGFDLRFRNFDVQQINKVSPAIDSLLPMLKSFKGTVELDIAAEAVLDSTFGVKLPSLRSATYIRGDSLVLLDGETFAKISKMLMFKNKKENVFDSVSVNITIADGNIKIYPFVVEIDRYKAAVGGTQFLDGSFDYHISILRSPLPFKAGVNVRGTVDKMRFGIGKAKYKDLVTPTEIRSVENLRINLRDEISGRFKNISERRKWAKRASSQTDVNWEAKRDSIQRANALQLQQSEATDSAYTITQEIPTDTTITPPNI